MEARPSPGPTTMEATDVTAVRDREQQTPEPVTDVPEARRRRPARRLQTAGAWTAAAAVAVTLSFAAGRGGTAPASATSPSSSPSPSASAPDPEAAAIAAKRAAPMTTATTTASFRGVTVTVATSGSVAVNRRSLKVVSAPTDLSTYRELAWRADAGHPVGDARCTQNYRFNPGQAVSSRPTMLLCWRTGPSRSAYILAVDVDQHPVERDAVTALDRGWNAG